MESKNNLAFLEAQISESIAAFESSSNWYRKRYYLSSIGTAALSAIITIIAGWSVSFETAKVDSNDIILVLGAITSVLTVWGAFFSPKETWLMYAENLNDFRKLRAKIEFLKHGTDTITTHDCKSLFEEYQHIHDKANATWLDLRKTHNK